VALLTCPDCGKQVSSAAPACIHCGRPSASISLRPSEPRSAVARSNPEFRCPKCDSDDVRRLSVVHASGLSTTQSLSSAIGIGIDAGGDLGLAGGAISSSGIQQTALARAAAPPTPRMVSNRPAIAWGCIAGTMAGMFASGILGSSDAAGLLGLAVFAAVSLLVGIRVYKGQYRAAKDHNDRVYRPQRAIWDRSIMCMRCGAVTDPGGRPVPHH
jgi:hypothetical protein